MSIISSFWLSSASFFNPVQAIFNGNFWQVVVDKFGLLEGKNVLDLACGTGEFRKYIKPKMYLGIDINPAYIADAKKRAVSFNKTSFSVADATNLIIKKDFDIAFLISSGHHLSDKQMKDLIFSLKRNRIKQLIIVDDIPIGLFAGTLAWLDSFLGGGHYFREVKEIVKLVSKDLKIIEQGTLYAKLSFYKYPYVVAQF